MLEIRRVQRSAAFDRFVELLGLYEAGLPGDLRHKKAPNMEALTASHGGRSAAFLAMCGGEAVGCVAVREVDGATAVLRRLFVLPEHRGAGIARALVEAVLAFAKRQRYERVVLDTDKGRLRRAYDLYRSFGFKECAPFAEVDYESPTFMELRLAPDHRIE